MVKFKGKLPFSAFEIGNPSGLPISPRLRRQIPFDSSVKP